MLEVVDEEDNVIGLETREKIHREGLLHRDIHLWFITPKNEIIFQLRSKLKDSFPGMLDATVAGHVEPGASYEETASKECKEETGIDIDISKLILLKKMKNESFDNIKNNTHRTMDRQYAYLYEGSINNLKIEKDSAEGFESWSIGKLHNLSEKERERFIPARISKNMLELFDKAREVAANLSFSFRRFEKRDEEVVYNLHVTAMEQVGTFIDIPELRELWDKDLKNIESVYINNNGEFYVVTLKDKIIGMGGIRKVDETTTEVKRMRVEPSMQGKGIGKLILDKLIEKAKELGYKKLILDTAEKQKAARHLYETRGFREYKRGEIAGQETIYYQLEI